MEVKMAKKFTKCNFYKMVEEAAKIDMDLYFVLRTGVEWNISLTDVYKFLKPLMEDKIDKITIEDFRLSVILAVVQLRINDVKKCLKRYVDEFYAYNKDKDIIKDYIDNYNIEYNMDNEGFIYFKKPFHIFYLPEDHLTVKRIRKIVDMLAEEALAKQI
jgi:hypothetical protein